MPFAIPFSVPISPCAILARCMKTTGDESAFYVYDLEAPERNNFFDKLGSLKKTLNMWSQRDLSIYGRINLIKTLALSKLVFICSVMETPKNFCKEVNKITFDFILHHKPAKIVIKKRLPLSSRIQLVAWT